MGRPKKPQQTYLYHTSPERKYILNPVSPFST